MNLERAIVITIFIKLLKKRESVREFAVAKFYAEKTPLFHW